MPLIIGTLLLVVVSVFNRIDESLNRLLVLLPFVSVAVFAVATLVISSWSIGPGAALWAVMAIFFAGLALSGLGWSIDGCATPIGGSNSVAWSAWQSSATCPT